MHWEFYHDSVLAIEMENKILQKESFFNYDANLTSVIIMELKFIFFFVMLVSLYDLISCDVINVKNFREILRYFFLILATPLDILKIHR